MARAGAIALIALLAAACGPRSELSNVWSDPAELRPFGRLLVIAISESVTGRRSYEDAMTAALGERGVAAIPSYSLLPGPERLSESAIREAVRKSEVEGVLLTRLIGVDEDTTYIPPQTYVTPRAYGGYGPYGYYGMGYDVVHEPGRVIKHTTVRLETHLYAAGSGKLVWAAHSDTFDPSSTDAAIQSVTKTIAKRLAADGAVPGG